MSRRYAWRVDKDHLLDPADSASRDEAGITGPRDAPEHLLTALNAGMKSGAQVVDGLTVQDIRMYDDDGELYYTGRYIGPDDDDMFGPLDDFGTPNAGCTEIHYRVNGKWTAL